MTLTLPTTIARAALLDAACRSTGHSLASLLASRLTRHTPDPAPATAPAPAAEDAATPAAAAAPRAATTTGHPASTPLVPQAQPDIARAAAHFGLEL